jgi:dTMP kinase
MASINDLATAAVSALVTPAPTTAAAPPSPLPLPDSARAGTEDGAHGEPAVARGALVVLEGLDRSGKTTQVKLLEQRFVELGRKVKVMRFPGMLATYLSYIA